VTARSALSARSIGRPASKMMSLSKDQGPQQHEQDTHKHYLRLREGFQRKGVCKSSQGLMWGKVKCVWLSRGVHLIDSRAPDKHMYRR
jgi:hypothetical protein